MLKKPHFKQIFTAHLTSVIKKMQKYQCVPNKMNFKQNNAEFFIAKQGDKVFRELGQTRARRALFMMKIKKCARLKYSTKLFFIDP